MLTSIGRNCRFLQGPKTKRHSVSRMRQALDAGQELSETLLNYRRDGTPFMNLLMVAPLHDNRGNVKYYIGAQVEVTGLVEDGKGIDGFGRFLLNERAKHARLDSKAAEGDSRPSKDTDSKDAKKKALSKLRDLSEMV